MALPRFSRLPQERQQQILSVARERLTRDGVEGASYSQIIAEAGISRTTAYLYFDGREDLVAEVVRDSVARALAALGRWPEVTSGEQFWAELRGGAERLAAFVAAHPADHAVLRAAYRSGVASLTPVAAEGATWLAAMLDSGIRLGVVRGDVDRSLLMAATAAVLLAMDGWALERMAAGAPVDLDMPFGLLRGLWSSPS